MRVLISEKLSEHKYKTPEGYLICTDAILARTGKQTYTRDELFGDGDNTEVNVDRPYNEVMNEKTIASFENKPVTFDHPEEDVNIGNYKSYAVGYVRDVHQGRVDGKDVILGNLVITDQDAINAIENGDHTDLSCGYDCDIRDDGNGNYAQNNIRGNHVALCKEGRAGMARIVDSKAKDAGDYSWFKGYINGDLQSFNIDSLISSVKSKRRPLHANLTGKSGNVYTVFIDGNLESDVDKGSGMWIDIVVEYPDRQQKRLISKDFNSWNECRNIFNTFKNNFRDSVDDSKVKDSNYIYEFYYNDIDNEDKRMMRKYNLEVVGKSGKERGERNLAVKGSLENLKRYAKEWLGYDLHPNYLIPESQFAYDMYDSVKDDNLLGKRVRIRKRYSNLDGTIGTIFSYEGTNYDDEVEVERNGHIYKVDYEDIEFLDSKVRDWTPEEVKQFKVERRGRGYGVYYKGQLISKYDDYDEYEAQEELKRLRKYYYADSIKDASYTLTRKRDDKVEFARIAKKYNLKTYSNDTIEGRPDNIEEFIHDYCKERFDKNRLRDAMKDSKFMTMSGVIKMLNVVNAYKKVKDASADEWVIRNTGLAYEVWNDDKMVKKFPTKKLAVEWIRGRFPTDKITEA